MRFRHEYSPGLCPYRSDTEEIRWDVVGCNLACQFCWSPASRSGCQSVQLDPAAVVSAIRNHASHPQREFIRFTGGEPTLYWKELQTVIEKLYDDSALSKVPILIQTNGIEIGKGAASVEWLKARGEQRILVELSLKGTNRDEFALLTSRDPGWYDHQLRAYDAVRNVTTDNPNVRCVAVLGVYHSSTSGLSAYAFVGRNGRLLFDDESLWDPSFRRIWSAAGRLRWVEPLRMSPKGMWDGLLLRCGELGTGLIRYFPDRVATNERRLFPAKPRSTDYATSIVEGEYWL